MQSNKHFLAMRRCRSLLRLAATLQVARRLLHLKGKYRQPLAWHPTFSPPISPAPFSDPTLRFQRIPSASLRRAIQVSPDGQEPTCRLFLASMVCLFTTMVAQFLFRIYLRAVLFRLSFLWIAILLRVMWPRMPHQLALNAIIGILFF